MKINFSEEEITHLLQAWAAISLSFAILISRAERGFVNFSENLLISCFSVGIAFLVHELSHKFLAQRYGCFAEFRKFDLGLIFAILGSFLGLLFVVPGAVFIFGFISEKENGKIALAGPVSNLILSLILILILAFFSPLPLIFRKIFSVAVQVNSGLAFFNLLPIPPLDGFKVMNWSFNIWLISILIAGFLSFFL